MRFPVCVRGGGADGISIAAFNILNMSSSGKYGCTVLLGATRPLGARWSLWYLTDQACMLY